MNTEALSVFRIGMPAVDCVQRIISMLPDIRTANFISYNVFPSIQKRLNKTTLLSEHQKIGQLLIHDTSNRRMITIDRSGLPVLDAVLEDAVGSQEKAIGFVSKVETMDGLVMHVPMMDLRVSVSESNQSEVAAVLKRISPGRGVLLASGESYHFYSIDLLSEREWVAFMGRTLLLSPLVDDRYIAHRLIDGFSVLRITSTSAKPSVPVVVDVW